MPALLCAAPGFGVRTSPLPSLSFCPLLQPTGDVSFLQGCLRCEAGAGQDGEEMMGRSLPWCLSVAAWAHGRNGFGFMSSGGSEDDNNRNYSKHSLSLQSVLLCPSASAGNQMSHLQGMNLQRLGGGCFALPHLGGNLSVTLPGGMSSWCESSSFRAAFLPKHVYFELKMR